MTIAFVQGPASVTGSAASIAATFAGSTPAGRLVVVTITQSYGANPPRAITNVRDSIDGAVDYALLHETNNGGTLYVHEYGRIVTTAGTRTVTCTFAGAADASLAINEYSSTSGFELDAARSANVGTGTAVQAGSITPSGTALYLMASGWTNGTGTSMTPTAGWNGRQERESGSSSLIEVQDLITSGAQNPAMALGASQAWAAVMVSYHEISAANIKRAVSNNTGGMRDLTGGMQ